jgi:D-alanyl-D-alanine carboxypeptidase/D-alanyl-D-alanine-endopeptidase (penicillin-binding protein 4)
MKSRTSLQSIVPVGHLILTAFLIFSTSFRCRADETGKGSDPILVAKIDSLLADKNMQTGFQGVLIQSLKDKTILYERNADKLFLPASNNKLFTSAAALSVLGAGFVYTTRVVAAAAPDKKGVIHADLTLVGSGDPLLTYADLTGLAHALRTAGVRKIEGMVMADDSLFDQQRLGDGWTWNDEPAYYSAQVSALNMDENLVNVRVFPGAKEGDAVRVVVSPTEKYMTVQNLAKTSAPDTKSTLIVDRARGQNLILVTGVLPLGTAENAAPNVPVTVEDPTHFALTVFQEALTKEGIRVAHKRFPPPTGTVALAQHTSVPFAQILKLLNKPSDNLMAECLLKTVGAVKKGQGTAGSNGTGALTAREFFTSIGIDVAHLHQTDGSGLSRQNFASPRVFVQLLSYLHAQPDFPLLYDSLPIAGVDGTLRNRLKNTLAAYNCHAKTGSLSQVSSLSGYVTTREGEMLLFSILMNNQIGAGRVPISIQDNIVLLLANYTRPGAVHAQ